MREKILGHWKNKRVTTKLLSALSCLVILFLSMFIVKENWGVKSQVVNEKVDSKLTLSHFSLVNQATTTQSPKKIFTIIEALKGGKGGGSISIQLDSAKEANYKLQYSKGETNVWKDVANRKITDLEAGIYHFRWYPKTNTHAIETINSQRVEAGNKIAIPKKPKFIPSELTSKDKQDASITIIIDEIDQMDPYTQLQQYKENVWVNIGQANFNPGSTWRLVNKYSKLQFSKVLKEDSKRIWTDVKKNKMEKLASGTYEFKWVGKYGEIYSDGSKEIKINERVVILPTNKIGIPPIPSLKGFEPTSKGKNDASIEIEIPIGSDFKMQYLEKGSLEWHDVPSNDVKNIKTTNFTIRKVSKYSKLKYWKYQDGPQDNIKLIDVITNKITNKIIKLNSEKSESEKYKITNLESGKYGFKWVPAQKSNVYIDSNNKNEWSVDINESKKIIVPDLSVDKMVSPSNSKIKNGEIQFNKSVKNDYAILLYSDDSGITWKEVDVQTNKIQGVSNELIQLKWKPKSAGDYFFF